MSSTMTVVKAVSTWVRPRSSLGGRARIAVRAMDRHQIRPQTAKPIPSAWTRAGRLTRSRAVVIVPRVSRK